MEEGERGERWRRCAMRAGTLTVLALGAGEVELAMLLWKGEQTMKHSLWHERSPGDDQALTVVEWELETVKERWVALVSGSRGFAG